SHSTAGGKTKNSYKDVLNKYTFIQASFPLNNSNNSREGGFLFLCVEAIILFVLYQASPAD
ncbi:MAG: hypothetical protein M3342_04960, partial [Bacteroidota bacterium]|nr:hypothetical protein [Bacteroidota bacterium]